MPASTRASMRALAPVYGEGWDCGTDCGAVTISSLAYFRRKYLRHCCCIGHSETSARCARARQAKYGLRPFMVDQRLFFTELLGLKVFDLKGRTLGVVKDAAIVPLLDPVRVDRY